ncbi:hypothetical protein HS1genome_0308 [Sulfodiicoccus acidiphilus]|uniref:DUF106 domain-containing protein n=1 Tax=Sulfodiicoccus acidiphilus TaxID=1670455 RepID=A0A348B167_9CREN|nr:hypothetical protein [Sulfodiicoccus acidiphilus]BBD71919.1 hypothetical protein HS1genome_0308 [Sulfodiicoccus acidiphilus]GGT91459.1 hypothetical protein GCM10007116_06470 [Sulfodiicoccus acidiphilus]
MLLYLVLILAAGILGDFSSYLLYRLYLKRKIALALAQLNKLDERLSVVSSVKRKERVKRKLSKDIQQTQSTVYKYTFMRTMYTLAIYMVLFYVVISLLNFPVRFPFYVPAITMLQGHHYLLVGGSLFVFIMAFVLFSPLALRQPNLYR